jgi:hypothetical protein
MDFAEEQRVYGSGSEWQRAQLFAKMTDVFERMVAWQSELGGAAEAFSAIERSRARSLLDQMATQGVDLLAGAAQGTSGRAPPERTGGPAPGGDLGETNPPAGGPPRPCL